ncbi:D-xylose 1-dehydrogenase [Colletotrichum viniferum]|nr:D-xylose 1-dehydrogenase [Colletotrichum viniferum]
MVTSHMVNPRLAGGILFDGGIYSLTWAFQTLYHTQPADSRQRPIVKSAVAKYDPTGVDAMTTLLLEFPRSQENGGPTHAIASTSLGLSNDAVAGAKDAIVPNIRIQGPTRTRLVLKDGTVEDKQWPQPGPGVGSGWYNGYGLTPHPEGEGHGLFWEADDAGRALIEGRKEGSFLGLDESILVMENMDEVWDSAGLRYPEEIETTNFPTQI